MVAQVADVPYPPPEEPISNIIHVIIGGLPEGISHAYLKNKARRIPPEETRNKRLKRDEVITFSKADIVPNQMPSANKNHCLQHRDKESVCGQRRYC